VEVFLVTDAIVVERDEEGVITVREPREHGVVVSKVYLDRGTGLIFEVVATPSGERRFMTPEEIEAQWGASTAKRVIELSRPSRD
jgi:hypothetical protein